MHAEKTEIMTGAQSGDKFAAVIDEELAATAAQQASNKAN